MTEKLKLKKALITGGSNGIGRAIAKAFAKEGCCVVFTYLSDNQSADSLIHEITSLGGQAYGLKVDLNDKDRLENLVKTAISYTGQIDVLVNNVGFLTRTNGLETTPEQFDQVIHLNLKVPFFLTQLLARHMIDSGIQGSIINISSLSAEKTISRVPHYQCAKAGLNMLTKSFATELASYQIRVNTISPGLTRTKANKDQWNNNLTVWEERSRFIPLKRAGTPEDFQATAVLLASDESKWMTGINITIDGGMSLL